MKTYPLARPEVNDKDIAAVNAVLKSQFLSRGPVIKAFEKAFCGLTGCQYACAVSSGTAGLIIALQALGVKAGSEVITVSFTVPATVNSIVAIGAVPVMIDIEPQSYGMDLSALKAAITDKTAAIIVVHAFGQAAPIRQILEIAQCTGLKVIEDACEAIGNKYDDTMLGRFGDIGVFGFYPNKQITAGEGGMIITDDQKLVESCDLLRNHGRSMNGDLYDQMTYGWNARLSDINAALGLSQLKRLHSIIQKRRELAAYYHQQLGDHQSLIECPNFGQHETESAWFVYVIRVLKGNRDVLFDLMAKDGIQCGRYFAPVHLQPYYRAQQPQLQLINTQRIADQCLALPFFTQLNKRDIVYICDKLLKNAELS